MDERQDGVLTPDRPWPGMRPYREQDAGYFFGRSAEIADLRSRLERSMLTLLYARGGLGKTSLVRAGLSPTLPERGFLPVYLRPRLLLESARDAVAEILRCIGDAAKQAGVEASSPLAAPTLWELFHRTSFGLWDESNRLTTPVLIFDQFEEVFQIIDEDPAAAPRAKALLDNIADLVENRLPARLVAIDLPKDDAHHFNTGTPACRVILSFREDYLPQVRRLRVVLPSVIENHVRLEPLSGVRALEVVESAGREHIDADAARDLVRAVGRRAGLLQQLLEPQVTAAADAPDSVAKLEVEPSILSVVCFYLNAERSKRSSSTIDVGLVKRMQPQAIFEDYYRQAMASAGPAARLFVETRLVTAGGERVLYPMNAVAGAGPELNAAVNSLVEQGILRKEWLGGEQRLEISHDLLLRPVRQALEVAAAAASRRRRTTTLAAVGAAIVLLFGGVWEYQRGKLAIEYEARQSQTETVLVAYASSAAVYPPAVSAADQIAALTQLVSDAPSTAEKVVALGQLFDKSAELAPSLPPIPGRLLQESTVDYIQLIIDRSGATQAEISGLLPRLRAEVDKSCASGRRLSDDQAVIWFADRGGVPSACK